MICPIKRQDCQAIAQMEASCFNDAWDENAYAKEWEKTYAKGWMIDGIGYIWTWFLYENAEIVRVAFCQRQEIKAMRKNWWRMRCKRLNKLIARR